MMSPIARQQIRNDLDLIERFTQSYRERFASAIEELNGSPNAQTGERCLRLCVESVNMLLSLQDRMAAALREIGV